MVSSGIFVVAISVKLGKPKKHRNFGANCFLEARTSRVLANLTQIYIVRFSLSNLVFTSPGSTNLETVRLS